MCDPVTGAALLGGLTFANQLSARKMGKEAAKGINASYQDAAKELALQSGAEMSDRARASRRERERIRVLGGEAGISGNSFETNLANSLMQQSLNQERLDQNFNTQMSQLTRSTKQALSGIQIPTALGIIANTTIGAAQGYMMGSSIASAGQPAAASSVPIKA